MNSVIEENFTQTNEGLNGEFNNIEVGCITSKNDAFSLDTEGNLVVNSITTVNGGGQNINFGQIYPIGSLYFNVGEVSPSTLFGGTWEKIEGKFLLASSTTYTLGSEGGSVEHNHSSAAHSHGSGDLYAAVNFMGTYGTFYNTRTTGVSFTANEMKADSGAGYSNGTVRGEGINVFGSTSSVTPGNTGNASSLPPYLAINVWKRTA